MKNKKDLEIFRRNILLSEQKESNVTNSLTYLLFSKGLPLLSPIVLGMLAKKVNPKNKALKFILQKSILLGIPFVLKAIFRKK